MTIKTKTYPAHYRLNDDTIQTLEEHLQGVMTMCERFAEGIHFSYTGKLVGMLHDIGKYTDEFYEYITEAIHMEKAGEKKLKRNVDHGKYGALLVLDRYHNGNALERVVSEIIAMVICYHHGGLEDYISDDLEVKLLNRCGWPSLDGKNDIAYNQACECLFERIISPEQLDELFNKSVNEMRVFIEGQKEAGTILNFRVHLLIKILYSCLIDADRYDTYLFMQNCQDKEGPEPNSLWQEFSRKLETKEEGFRNQVAGSELEERIKNLRHDIWKQCKEFSSRPSGIYTMTVPTGGGKTLSSLRYALNHAMETGKKRILYVLPFTSIIEQNAGVVRDVLDAKEYLLEHHSNVINEEAEYGTDEYEYRQLLTEQWSVPIIFTTMVQFLNSFYAGGTKSIRRLHNLTDTIIIFDEVQALPIKCVSLFNETVNFLASYCRDTIILCSATQPNFGKVKHKINNSGEMISDLSDKFHNFKRMDIIDTRYKNKMSLSEMGKFIVDLKEENESILIILNTKNTAEEVYREVKLKLEDNQEFIYYFLSTNLCPSHRKEIISQMKKDLSNHKRVICVSTQLIEAGVDISFSCVVRHIAGLDSIAQASGRGNRHGESSIKKTYIVQLEDEKLGSLKEIDIGEKCTISVLDEFKRDSQRFDNNLLSPKAIESYYYYFFAEHDIEKMMDYPVEEKRTSVFNMLSSPQKKIAYKNKNNEKFPLELEFQFKTASEHFEVIDELSVPILVPYKEGKEKINELLSKGNMIPSIKLIRSLQPYMVNVSKGVQKKLEKNQAIIREERSGVMILKDNYYDMELGVVPEGEKLDMLLIGW